VSGGDTLAIALVGHAIMALASLPGGLVFFRDPNRHGPGGGDVTVESDFPSGPGDPGDPGGPGGSGGPGEPDPEFPDAPGKMRRVVQRFLTPPLLVTLYYWLRDHATVSFRAEVEATRNLRFGRGCTVSSFVKIKATDGVISIGERSGFATGCFVSAGRKGMRIGRNVLFGPNVTVLGQTYVYDDLDVPFEDQGTISKGIRIGNNVWIGAGSVIADGAVLGDNTVVVANSLVTRRYPPNVIIQGAPAKVIMRRGRREEEPPGRKVECAIESSRSSAAPSPTSTTSSTTKS
jgi:acetyltransferase-like isoleucine patch superfamily enzyme